MDFLLNLVEMLTARTNCAQIKSTYPESEKYCSEDYGQACNFQFHDWKL